VDFVMNQFDEDVRSMVQVKMVHGSWERGAANRVRVEVSSLGPIPCLFHSLDDFVMTCVFLHGN
jgi:hypothetical protein